MKLKNGVAAIQIQADARPIANTVLETAKPACNATIYNQVRAD